MKCKFCDYPDSSVVYTRHDDKRNLILRRRQCSKCAMRYTTQEKVKNLEDYLRKIGKG